MSAREMHYAELEEGSTYVTVLRPFAERRTKACFHISLFIMGMCIIVYRTMQFFPFLLFLLFYIKFIGENYLVFS